MTQKKNITLIRLAVIYIVAAPKVLSKRKFSQKKRFCKFVRKISKLAKITSFQKRFIREIS